MIQFDDLLAPQAVRVGLTLSSKKQLFLKVSELASAAYGTDAGEVFDRLTERERLGSTGFGGGVAIPHAKLENIDRVRGVALLLAQPLGFDAVDEQPVDVIFALLSPADSGAEHLKTLARVSRFLRNEGQVARLRGVGSAEALHALLTSGETRDAA